MADWLEFWEKLYGDGKYDFGDYVKSIGLSSVDGTRDTDTNGRLDIDCSALVYNVLSKSGFKIGHYTTPNLGRVTWPLVGPLEGLIHSSASADYELLNDKNKAKRGDVVVFNPVDFPYVGTHCGIIDSVSGVVDGKLYGNVFNSTSNGPDVVTFGNKNLGTKLGQPIAILRPKLRDTTTSSININSIQGGINFKQTDANALTAGGFRKFLQEYVGAIVGGKLGIDLKQLVADYNDLYLQNGYNNNIAAPMTATAGNERACMLGWHGADNLTGGAANDLLFGGDGADSLSGGNGDDILIGGYGDDVLDGGLGYDEYRYTIGDGNDQIIDADMKGEIDIYDTNGYKIPLYAFYKTGANEWTSFEDKNTKITGNILTLSNGSTINLGSSFHSGDFGINLIDIPTTPENFNAISLDAVDNEHINHQNSPDYGTLANDKIIGGAGNDWVANWSDSGQYGGDDWIIGGAGNDILNSASPDGNDIVEGDAGIDVLFGNSKSNKLYCDTPGEMEQLITDGETAQSINTFGDIATGGDGNDFIYGGNTKDLLFGGKDNDLIVGGGGDDYIYGDAYIYGVNVEQSLSEREKDSYTGFTDWSYTIQQNGDTYTSDLQNVYVDAESYQNVGDDVIYAGNGNDYVESGYGNDEVYGGTGNDTIFGSANNDFIDGGSGDDILSGDIGDLLCPELNVDDYIASKDKIHFNISLAA